MRMLWKPLVSVGLGWLVVSLVVIAQDGWAVCGVDTCQTFEKAALCSPAPVQSYCYLEPLCASLGCLQDWPKRHFDIKHSICHTMGTRPGHVKRCRMIVDFWTEQHPHD